MNQYDQISKRQQTTIIVIQIRHERLRRNVQLVLTSRVSAARAAGLALARAMMPALRQLPLGLRTPSRSALERPARYACFGSPVLRGLHREALSESIRLNRKLTSKGTRTNFVCDLPTLKPNRGYAAFIVAGVMALVHPEELRGPSRGVPASAMLHAPPN